MSPASAELLSAPSSRPEIGTAPSDRAEPCTVPVNWKVKGCQHQSAAGNREEEREHPPPLLWLQWASFHKKCNSPLPPSLSGLFERARCWGNCYEVGLWGYFNLSCNAISCKVRCCIIFSSWFDKAMFPVYNWHWGEKSNTFWDFSPQWIYKQHWSTCAWDLNKMAYLKPAAWLKGWH